jgi:glycosyltransferase involved in cell wall biosynthesis
MQQKIAIIVEPGFMQHHVGVRNYLIALHDLLSREHRVDWVSYERQPTGEPLWFHLFPQSVGAAGPATQDQVIAGTPAEVLRHVRSHARRRETVTTSDSWQTAIGTDLSVEGYDAIIISNPWLIGFEARLPARRLIGIVYDLVPNQYVVTTPQASKPFAFAASHRRGFVYYRDQCDVVLAISRAVADEFEAMFRMGRDRVIAMPPMLPKAYGDVQWSEHVRTRRVVLAGPFDRRKGLAIMPTILNAARESIDTVSIYGGVRCSRQELRDFFQALEVRHLEWYPLASAATVQRLFLEAKALLFPSFDEGLGLPILEAQHCGCRVMTRDKQPMCDLVGPGSSFVGADLAASGSTLAQMLEEPFNHVGLQRWAQERFGSQQVLDAVDAAIACREPYDLPAVLPWSDRRRGRPYTMEGRG